MKCLICNRPLGYYTWLKLIRNGYTSGVCNRPSCPAAAAALAESEKAAAK